MAKERNVGVRGQEWMTFKDTTLNLGAATCESLESVRRRSPMKGNTWRMLRDLSWNIICKSLIETGSHVQPSGVIALYL